MTIHRKPTMQPTDASRRRELGSYLWLFTYRQWALADKVIISSHGGVTTSRPREFEVLPHENFFFYSQMGQGAKASSLLTATYEGNWAERVGPGPCANYDLSKFQGSHGGPGGISLEDYAGIQLIQSTKEAKDQTFNNAFAEYGPALARKALGSLPGATAWEVGDQRQDFDVVTVRNRFWNNTVTLEYVMEQLRRVRHYREIHCAFCRVI
jgi:hypothetical protein